MSPRVELAMRWAAPLSPRHPPAAPKGLWHPTPSIHPEGRSAHRLSRWSRKTANRPATPGIGPKEPPPGGGGDLGPKAFRRSPRDHRPEGRSPGRKGSSHPATSLSTVTVGCLRRGVLPSQPDRTSPRRRLVPGADFSPDRRARPGGCANQASDPSTPTLPRCREQCSFFPGRLAIIKMKQCPNSCV